MKHALIALALVALLVPAQADPVAQIASPGKVLAVQVQIDGDVWNSGAGRSNFHYRRQQRLMAQRHESLLLVRNSSSLATRRPSLSYVARFADCASPMPDQKSPVHTVLAGDRVYEQRGFFIPVFIAGI